MIKAEQKELAEFVKEVHLSLRRKSQQIGAEAAWKEHLNSEHVLRNYAFAMKKLAQEFWSVNNESKNNILLCRIDWMVKSILDYYQDGGIQIEVEKEKKKLRVFCDKELVDIGEVERLSSENVIKPPYKVLDVGSCYNPFGKFEFLEVYPIDLYPASPEVKKCNFLELEFQKQPSVDWFRDYALQAPSEFFDVIVFSLFLEYLPSPKQRYLACVKAYESLKTNGILLIATPDSKHESANSKLMKNWKIAAGKIGFVRTKLEKLKYLYCMCFRKSASRKYALILNNIDKDINAEEMFVIPQDTVEYNTKEEESLKLERSESSESSSAMFTELPFC